ncbi:hypothetical protein EDB19DRAFT_1831842 [Suillus lakei]|nr:hypothetical protein EDB19DRAFT_1831842 [Suillus lakei]
MSAPVHVHPEDIIDTNKLITLIDDNHDAIHFEPTFNVFMLFSLPQGAPTTSVEFIGYILQFSNPTPPLGGNLGPSPQLLTEDEDAQGEADLEPTMHCTQAARPDTSTEDDPAPAPASAHLPKVTASMPTVDNDINMDFTARDDLPPCLEPSDTWQDTVPVLPVQPPTQLDIILKSIEALGTRFDSLLTRLDHAEALHEEMDSRVTALDKEWAQKFSVMEQRMWDVEIQTNTNMVSISHMAPFVNNPNTSKPFIPPPAKPIHDRPYGPMPLNWLSHLHPITGTGEQVDPSISLFGKQYTTLWNPFQGPQEAGLCQVSISAVHHSGGASASVVRTSGDSTP